MFLHHHHHHTLTGGLFFFSFLFLFSTPPRQKRSHLPGIYYTRVYYYCYCLLQLAVRFHRCRKERFIIIIGVRTSVFHASSPRRVRRTRRRDAQKKGKKKKHKKKQTTVAKIYGARVTETGRISTTTLARYGYASRAVAALKGKRRSRPFTEFRFCSTNLFFENFEFQCYFLISRFPFYSFRTSVIRYFIICICVCI